LKTLIIEPFFVGSHASWAEGYATHSHNEIDILKLSGNHWKWRMHGGAVTLARQFLERRLSPDLIVATDMLDLTTFLALTRERTAEVPTATYFHENQITYPWSPKDRDLKRDRDKNYGFINFTSALAADTVFFNSRFHLESFVGAIPDFLRQFPDHQELGQAERIIAKSKVLPLGLDLRMFDAVEPSDSEEQPLVLWNHRWEYDKNPVEFFDALITLFERGRKFGVVLLGEQFDVAPKEFVSGIKRLSDRILHSGFAESRTDYARWLKRCSIIPVTSHHDFFGASIVEAMYCGCFPLLPRRLSYPELIPDELHQRCFYEPESELVEKLDAAITNVDNPDTGAFRKAAARFDWSVMAPVYDDAFEHLTSSK